MAVGFGEPPQSSSEMATTNIQKVLRSALQFGRHTRTSKWGIGFGRVCMVVEY
jgi:hypothetical protein